jgi:RHS repeat-associated protein
MNSLPQISKTASRQKLPACGFAPRENRPERRAASRVWQRQRAKLASGKSLYNYFRDYDPSTGRYVQSDPIGLLGGMSTYGYGLGAPLMFSDPDGLKTVREALSALAKEKGLEKIPGMGKDIGGKALEDLLGIYAGLILCGEGTMPGNAERCLRKCTEIIVPVRDKMLDSAPSGPARGLMRRGIDNEAGGLIDGCTKSCLDKLQDFDQEKRKARK